eukprot:2719216-Pyramimonas_sp.AAC.1
MLGLVVPCPFPSSSLSSPLLVPAQAFWVKLAHPGAQRAPLLPCVWLCRAPDVCSGGGRAR